jgi:hypothetical protein
MWAAIALIFLIWAVGATAGMVYYYQTSDNQQRTINSLNSLISTTTYKCNLAINYGNGTTIWYNNTVIPIGFSLFNATLKVASVEYVTTSDIFITAMNGVSQDTRAGRYWVYDSFVNGTWEIIWLSVTQYQVQNNDTIMWSLKTF